MKKDWISFVTGAADCLSQKENYQRVIGQLAATVIELYGSKAIVEFANDIKETHGLKISPSTLRNYAWVFNKTVNLNLPDDLSYTALQHIASTDDPKLWTKVILEKSLSSDEVIHLIRQEKGLDKKNKKKFVCKNCGAENLI